MLAPVFAKSQITIDHTYTGVTGLQAIEFSSNGTKYQVNDTGSNQVKLYNTDYSLWLTIPLPTYAGYKLALEEWVSDNLFNSDNNVEMIVSYYSTNGAIYRPYYKSVLIDQSGGVLLDLDSCYGGSVFSVAGHYKLTTSNSAYTTKVYSLPGTLPCIACNSYLKVPGEINIGNNSTPTAVPNPSKDQVKIFYTLPDGVNQGMITIYNTTGQSVKSYTVTNAFPYITLDNSNLAPGVYYYSLMGIGIMPSGNKMVVVK